MAGKVIGASLNHGFAGNFARQPDLIAVTRPNNADVNIRFGSAVMADESGGVIPISAAFTADKFVGVAGSETKSAFDYLDQNKGGEYAPKEAVTVVQRGSISVICSTGTPVVGGDVYIRTVADGTKNIGDFETEADVDDTTKAAKNVKLTNAQWGGGTDVNKVAELVLLTRNRA